MRLWYNNTCSPRHTRTRAGPKSITQMQDRKAYMTDPMRHLVLKLVLLSLLLWPAPAVRAEDAPATFFLIDGSGSMWGRFEPDKRAKIDAVRELLKPVITSAGQTRIGLGSFGHRRKGDCSDVEIIAAPGLEHDAVLAPLEKLNPRGKGPLVDGLRQSVAAIGANRPASIIVINDGPDNCQQDTCAAAAEIAKSAPGVAIHMISIGVDPGDHPRLACVAKETGGQFYDVADPIALAAAIGDAVARTPAAAVGGAPAAEAIAPGTTGVAGASLRATAVLAEGTAPLAQPLRWRAIKHGTTDAVASAEAAQFSAALEPGTYDIEVQSGTITAKQQVTIENGKLASIAVPLNAGRLKVNAKYGKDGISASSAVVSILQTSTAGAITVWLGRLDTADTILPAATYTVAIADGHIKQERNITLDAGATAAADFVLGGGLMELSAIVHEGGEPLRDVTFSVAEDDPESPDGRREITRSLAPQAAFQLPAGTYYVSARSGGAETRQRIAVGAGDVVKRTLDLGAARLKISAPEIPTNSQEGHGIVYRVFATDGEKREVARSSKPEFETLLNAGRYRVTATLEAHNLTAAQDIVLEAGKAAHAVMKFDAAEISFKLPATATTVPGEVFWEIKDSKGRAFWHAAVAEPKILLAPGRYTVRVETRDRGTQAAFEVRNGENRQIDLGSVSPPSSE